MKIKRFTVQAAGEKKMNVHLIHIRKLVTNHSLQTRSSIPMASVVLHDDANLFL